jgi:outer membrane receptor protein involved in Fe transport
MFQKAVRAPNIAELFAGIQQGFPPFADPCNNGAGLNGTTTTQACLAWGVPAASIVGFVQADGQVQAAFTSNPNLIEETANTWTVGGVFTPHQIPNLELIVDYYSITVKNGVGLAFGGTNGLIAACLAAGGSFNVACDRTPRAADGQLGTLAGAVQNLTANLSRIEAKGLDVSISYNFDLEDAIGIPGTIDIDALYTHVFTSGFAALPGSPVVNTVGEFNFFPGGNIPEDKIAARATYRKGAYSLSLRWTMVGSMTNSYTVRFGCCIPSTIAAEHVLDVTFQWDVNDTIGLTLGVENVLNNKPPFMSGFGVEGNTDPSVFNAQVLGPRFFGRISANF